MAVWLLSFLQANKEASSVCHLVKSRWESATYKYPQNDAMVKAVKKHLYVYFIFKNTILYLIFIYCYSFLFYVLQNFPKKQ